MYLFICMCKSKYAMAFITQTMAAATTTEAAAVVVTHTCLFQFKKLRNFGIIHIFIFTRKYKMKLQGYLVV